MKSPIVATAFTTKYRIADSMDTSRMEENLIYHIAQIEKTATKDITEKIF